MFLGKYGPSAIGARFRPWLATLGVALMPISLNVAAQVSADGPSLSQIRELLVRADHEGLAKAHSIAEEHVRAFPKDAQAHYWLARTCGAKAAASGTLRSVTWWRCHGRHLGEAAQLQPTNSDFVVALIQFLSRAPMLVGGNRTEAEAWQSRLKANDPAAAHVAAGHLHYADGKLDAALASIYLALRFNPAHPDALTALGQVLSVHNRLPEGVRWFEAAVAANPKDQRARWAIIQYAVAAGALAAPALEYLDAIDQEPVALVAPWEAAWRRGQILMRQNRGREAAVALARAQSLNPSSSRVAASITELRAAGTAW